MPIVDGLTSTKLIRSHEKTNPQHSLSARAGMNGRVPVIAVSASLEESKRQTYIDAGFDGWILKPISFSRLSELMTGIVDEQMRADLLYQSGMWEKGGWFATANSEAVPEADTKPSGEGTRAGEEELGVAAPTIAGEEEKGGNTIDDEQERLRKQQKEGKIEPPADTREAPATQGDQTAPSPQGG